MKSNAKTVARIALAAIVLIFGQTVPRAGAAPTPVPVSDADRAFVAMVSQGGMFEVAAGKLAEAQGQKQDIRDQGATEAHDHSEVGAKLKSLAAAAGITVPGTLNAQFQSEYAGLKALAGVAFDDAYLRDMDTIHAKDGAAFAEEAASGTDPDLRGFAMETHRIVLRHIGEIQAIGPGQ